MALRWITAGAAALALPITSLTATCEGEGDPTGLPPTLEHDEVFNVSNPYNEPIAPGAELDPDSARYVARITEAAQTAGFAMNLNIYAVPVYYADIDTPRYPVALTYYGSYSFCLKSTFHDVPIPDFARADPGSDANLIILDRSTGCAYELWGYNVNAFAPTPNAWWASALPIQSDGVYKDTIGAGWAANHVTLNGAVWPDELASGHIPHALVFGLPGAAVRQGDPVPPATHNDGPSTAPDALPEAARVQLDPALDLDTLGLAPHERTIARAMQEYGMFLGLVTGGPVGLYGVSGQSAQQNPWQGAVPDAEAAYVDLRKIPLDHLRVLKIPETVPGVNTCADSPCGFYQ